jgi:2-polyprenyl-6-methoxyphenol hydroxylase-like FAD-dependent oxidoreductase
MAELVVLGGGMCGLITATLLARDGHAVTVLERDPMEPPGDVEAAWSDWQRRGVGQFRLLHYLQARFREEIETHLPELAAEMESLGAIRHQPTAVLPEQYTGGVRPGDERLTTITGRRPMLETAVANVAERTPGVTVRRGCAVTGFLTGASAAPGVTHIAGVRTESGEEIRADLVVDVSGRRSALPRLLEEAGARAPIDDEDDAGLVYYGRYFRSDDGSVPQMLGPLLANAGSVSTLTLPSDNGTWGLGILAASSDKPLRAVDGVSVMANLPDRIRTFVVDDTPVATGVVAVADSWSCTNPSVGRGITIGTLHAIALRDTVRATGPDAPLALVKAFADVTAADIEPWYRATVELDRARLDEMVALREGRDTASDDPNRAIGTALQRGAWSDPDLLRGLLEIASMLAMPGAVVGRPGMFDKVLEHTEDDEPFPAPSRDELLAVIA